MGNVRHLARLTAVGLAFWAALVVTAVSQDVASTAPDAAAQGAQPSGSPRPSPTVPSREAGNSSASDSAPPNRLWSAVSEAFNPNWFDPPRPQYCGPDDDFIPPPRTCYFRAEGGAMIRSATANTVFQAYYPVSMASGSTTTGSMTPVLFSKDINYEFTGAGNFLIGRALSDNFQIEGQYTGVLPQTNSNDVWNNTPNKFFQDPAKQSPVPGNMFSPFSDFGANNAIGIPGLDYNKYAKISCSSELNSVELNLRRQVPLPPELMSMSVLVGVRYVSLPDKFGYFTLSDVDAAGQYSLNGSLNEINISTTNELIGPQVGALVEFYAENHWWLTCEAKVALMNNSCQETSFYRNVDDGVPRSYESSQAGNRTSVLTDANFTCVYRWSPHFTTRLGYHALWLSNVAVAQNNFSSDINLYQYDQTTRLSAKSSVVYHGPFVGIDLNW